MKPEQLEYAAPGPGQCILHNMDGQLLLERADPVVAFPESLLRQVRDGAGPAGLSLLGADPKGRWSPDMKGAWLLAIDAANEHVRYKLERCKQPGYVLGFRAY